MLSRNNGFKSTLALPHLVFIESVCPAFLSSFSDGDLFIYTEQCSKFAPVGQRIIVVPTFFMRHLKILGALFRFRCTFQDPLGVAYYLSKNKSVISDGILTEWLHKKGHIKPDQFISVTNLVSTLKVNTNDQLIIGNNFYEFGTFSMKRYEEFLIALSRAYPMARYFPHPKEGREVPRRIFGKNMIESDVGIEIYCKENGLPSHIVGFLGSTAMASLGRLANSKIIIEGIRINGSICDGHAGDITDTHILAKKSIRVTLEDLAATVEDILRSASYVTIKTKEFLLTDRVPVIE
jgi:hypothetical protein